MDNKVHQAKEESEPRGDLHEGPKFWAARSFKSLYISRGNEWRGFVRQLHLVCSNIFCIGAWQHNTIWDGVCRKSERELSEMR
jgi:hypothetical protein